MKPLTFRDQLFEDLTIAMGPGLVGGIFCSSLRGAGLASYALALPLAWLAVPVAVCFWHAAARPAPPPPAGAARRALVLAAAVATLVLAVAGTGGTLILVLGHRLPWLDFPFAPAIIATVPLQAAWSAARRFRAG